jgi:hypothetical protein
VKTTTAHDHRPADPLLARVIASLRRDPRYVSVIEALAADANDGRRHAFGQ